MITVKAKYLQLSRIIEVKEEDFVMGSRSCYGDLLEAVRKKHPSLAYVVILALIDGAPPHSDTELKDGDEVDFLASPMGG